MTSLTTYLNDGAHPSARAILMLIQDFYIENSWSNKHKRYLAEIKVSRWENCREQGYVLTLVALDYKKQLNIAFFRHRNSDENCAVRWEQEVSNNSVTIDSANFGKTYKDKYDVSHSTNYNQIYEMAEWIQQELTNFWNIKVVNEEITSPFEPTDIV